MTPELRHLVRDRARSIQVRLNHGVVNPVIAATEAQRVFVEAGDVVRTRWMHLELNAYRDVAGSSLTEVLGDGADRRLIAHIAAYRTQLGTAGGRPFSYFFVESLAELMTAQVGAVTFGKPAVDLEFSPMAGAPFLATFPIEIFDRMLGGFLAALHLQLGALAR